jgi:LysM repeat protein
MKQFLWITPVAALALSFSSCTNQGSGDNPFNTGPFDAAGNYREDWDVDDPTKWSKPGKRPPAAVEEPPMIASNDQPPANSTPISSNPRETTRNTSQPVEVASRARAATSSSVKATSRPTTKSSATKSTSRKSVAKAKPKPKPKSTRYVVKKGDSLSAIASRTGSSVSAIQKANGIKGTLIRPGQSLAVPKR